MPIELFYKIKLDLDNFSSLLAELQPQFSVAVYAPLNQDCYLISSNTKAIFDEFNVPYGLEDICSRYSLSHMRLKFYKKSARRETPSVDE